MLLYNSAVSGNCYKVRLLLAHRGLEYETVEMSVVDRSNRSEVLGELNPALRVPTLVLDDGRPLAESNAILWYLGDGTDYVPEDDYERAQVLQWMFFEQYSHEPNIAVARFWLAYSGTPERFTDQLPARMKGGYAALDAMEGHLARSLVPRRRALLDRGHLALRVHARRARGRVRPRAVRGHPRLARPRRLAAGARHDRRVSGARVRFAPSPTGSLHLGNALTAVANRRFADERRGGLVLRIDDTDPSRSIAGGEDGDPRGPRVARDWRSTRARYARASVASSTPRRPSARWSAGAATRDDEGAVRLGRDGATLLRPDGTATYQLASVVDDLDLGITTIIRGSDHRPNLELHRRIARAIGGELPEVIHHGLVLGPDGKKLSKRHGHSSIAELRDDGFPAGAVRAYLDELGLPEHDVHLDLARLRRLATDAIAAMGDEELAEAAGAPLEAAPVLRGARSLVEAREYARLVADPARVELPADARPTLDRFAELRSAAPERLSHDESRAIVRELKAVGGDLRSLRLALTGAATGPELAAVLAAISRDEALARVAGASA